MQLLLAQFGAVSDKEPSGIGSPEGGMMGPAEGGAPPIITIDLSEEAPQESPGLLHSTAEFLIISITGCAPKKEMK